MLLRIRPGRWDEEPYDVDMPRPVRKSRVERMYLVTSVRNSRLISISYGDIEQTGHDIAVNNPSWSKFATRVSSSIIPYG